ncbi:MAG: hypothetical protein OXI53_07965 [Nitrospira sp.]|nr:hypothetical protein [Nitrospira sp.]MDE0405234.1 hypothetical protein [Nitrospira sp.]MDE0485807.1 hypothetical protein [Nitrospira sp.]
MERRHTGKKVLAIVLLLGAAFWAGMYLGRQPPEEIQKQFQELSQEVVDQTVGLVESDLLVQKKVLQATSGFLSGKSQILNDNTDEAIAELEKTLDYLEEAIKISPGGDTSDALLDTMANIGDLRRSLADGQAVSLDTWEEAQEKLEALLSQS